MKFLKLMPIVAFTLFSCGTVKQTNSEVNALWKVRSPWCVKLFGSKQRRDPRSVLAEICLGPDAGKSWSNEHRYWNDRISSLSVGRKVKVKLCHDVKNGKGSGKCATYKRSMGYVGIEHDNHFSWYSVKPR